MKEPSEEEKGHEDGNPLLLVFFIVFIFICFTIYWLSGSIAVVGRTILLVGGFIFINYLRKKFTSF